MTSSLPSWEYSQVIAVAAPSSVVVSIAAVQDLPLPARHYSTRPGVEVSSCALSWSERISASDLMRLQARSSVIQQVQGDACYEAVGLHHRAGRLDFGRELAVDPEQHCRALPWNPKRISCESSCSLTARTAASSWRLG